MNKILKTAAIVLGGLLALMVIAIVILVLVFDPNQYKGEIIQAVKTHTGREAKIEKKIGWSFFPRLGIEAGGLELANAAGFGKDPFARIEAAGVRVEVLPLFRGQLAVDTVYLHGLTLNLAKNAAGNNNWEDLARHKAPDKTAPAPKTPAGAAAKGPALAALTVGRVEVRRGMVNWQDAAAAGPITVRDIELTTGRFVAGAPTDLALGLTLAGAQAQPIKVALKSQVTASEDTLKLGNLDLKVDDSRLTGSMEVRNFASPALRFDLALDRIDLDRYLPKAEAKPTADKPATGGAAAVVLPLGALRSLDVQGKFRIQQLKVMNLRSSEVDTRLNAAKGLITVGPNRAKLYGGSYEGQTVLDVRGKTPTLNLDEKLAGVQLAALGKDAYGIDNFAGTANLGAKMSAAGFDAPQIISTLNGRASFAVANGSIKGVDLKKMLTAIETALREKKLEAVRTLAPAPGDETKFTRLGGNIQVTNGVARNDDLALESPGLVRVTGRGSADLNRQQLDYRLTVGSIPIAIQGPFTALKFRPEVGEVAKEAAKQKLEQKLRDKLKLRR